MLKVKRGPYGKIEVYRGPNAEKKGPQRSKVLNRGQRTLQAPSLTKQKGGDFFFNGKIIKKPKKPKKPK